MWEMKLLDYTKSGWILWEISDVDVIHKTRPLWNYPVTLSAFYLQAHIFDVKHYRIVPNFREIKFSQIGLLQIFAEINFADEGFLLATPIYAAACTIRADSCLQRHPQLLASGSKRFCSGANFVLEPSQFRSPTTLLKLKTNASFSCTSTGFIAANMWWWK